MFKLITVFLFSAIVDCSLGNDIDNRDRNENLIAVVQIHRHGQRVPVSFYANDQYSDSSYWPAAGGQLTNTGKNQHWNLGRYTRTRYNTFLPEQFDPDVFYAQTTDVDRTHMSAQANLAGIFPPRGSAVWNELIRWQPIPLRIADSSVLSAIPSCSIYSAETASVVVNADDFKQINEEYADVYAYLTENSGTNVTDVSGVFSIYDPVSIEIQRGYRQPNWVPRVYPEPLTKLTGYYFWAHSYTDTQKRLAAGLWLYTILEYFSEMWQDSTSSEKYQLYSAHDYNIAAILNTLGDYQKQVPGFASTIYFELRNSSGTAILNIFSRDNGIFKPIIIQGCSINCPLSEAKTLLNPWLVNSTIWTAECSATRTALTNLEKVQSDLSIRKAHEQLEIHYEAEKGNSHSKKRVNNKM